jgi:hypothetical protein
MSTNADHAGRICAVSRSECSIMALVQAHDYCGRISEALVDQPLLDRCLGVAAGHRADHVVGPGRA